VPPVDRIRYSEDRRRPEKAESYNVKYEQELHKRVSDRNEKRLLELILSRVGHQERLLDVPCGAGRLSGVLSRWADHVTEVDYSFPMLGLCRANAADYVPHVANATAFELPFRDESFDVVASIRLSHHIPEHVDRLRHLRELCRVSRGHVLVSFFDHDSFKNRMRRARARLGEGKRAKKTLSRENVIQTAEACGFALAGRWPLSCVFSGHCFALLSRKS
jgi:SAM-dependent methyltransferase